MNAIIQYVKNATTAASAVSSQCNYRDNYYGDQVCLLQGQQDGSVVTVLDSYALSHG